MSKVTKPRASEEIWHLGIEDLLMPSAAAAPAAVPGPFAINLRTSSTPIGEISRALQRFEQLRVYRLERRHEGRPQYLLRLGTIETELEADAILEALREDYPGAFKVSAGEDDKNAVAAAAASAPARSAARQPKPRRAEPLPAPRKAPAATSTRAADPADAFRWDIDQVLPGLGAPRPQRAMTPVARAAIPPADTLRPRALGEELDCDPDAVTDQVESPVFTFQATIAAHAHTPAAPAESAVVPPEPTDGAVEAHSGAPPSTSASGPGDAPQVDSTQSVRALGSLEPGNDQASGWFAIQLMLSEQEIDPHDVPNLSIFAEYRLYALTGLDQDRLVHALRLGFFSSESAAAAVAGYLATVFDAPCIKRVGLEEHERFEERRVAARKDVGDLEGHDVIELAAPAPSPLGRTDGKLPAGAERKAPEASSIWSRLIPTRKR